MTSSQYFKALTVLCYALIGGLTVFSLIILLLTLNGFSANRIPELVNIFNIMVPVFALGGLLAGNTLYKNRILAIKDTAQGLADKLNGYRAAVILRYALLDGPALFSIIAFFLTGDMRLLIVTGAVILLMLYLLPNRQRLIRELELSSGEADIINDPNGIIK